MRIKTTVAITTVLLSICAADVAGQADSISAWTTRLQSGSLSEKVQAVSQLSVIQPSTLPAETLAAAAAELDRIGRVDLGAEAAAEGLTGDELIGDYFVSLTVMAAVAGTVEADLALVNSLAVSRGISRIVAQLGDLAIPVLSQMTANDDKAGDAIETMALAWFWADSTGALLSIESRSSILRAILVGAGSTDFGIQLATATATRLSGDPALIPLLSFLEEIAEQSDPELQRVIRNVMGVRRTRLEQSTAGMTDAERLGRVKRLGEVMCLGSTGEQALACADYEAHMAAAEQAFLLGDLTSSAASLSAAGAAAEQAGSEGLFSPAQAATLAGGTELVLPRQSMSAGVTSDTYLKRGTPNKNQGADSILRIRQSGKNRALLRFDDAAFTGVTGQVVSARIEVDIVFNADNWGTTGRTVDAHRMLVDWTEMGATWRCGEDADPTDQSPDCGTTAWEMQSLSPTPFAAAPSGTVLITKELTGVVSLDVTDDVRAIIAGQAPNFGWILKKTQEGPAGHIQLGTRESGVPARLVIEVIN